MPRQTELTREENTRRRDIGTGIYYELLTSDFLDLFFYATLRPRVLALWKGDQVGGTVWNTDEGVRVYGASDSIVCLVTNTEGAIAIRRYLDRNGGFADVQQKIKELPLDESEGLHQDLAELFARWVVIGKVSEYDASSGGVAEFIRKHTRQEGDTEPLRKLVSTHTVDTGRTTGLQLRSIPTAQANHDINASAPHVVTNEELDVLIEEEHKNARSRFRDARRLMALSRARNASSGHGFARSPAGPVLQLNPWAGNETINHSDYWVHVDGGGTLTLHSAAPSRSAPMLSIGGGNQTFKSNEQQRIFNTTRQSYTQEAQMNNPLQVFTSSFFTPVPSLISSIFSPLTSVVENPQLVLGLLALVLLNEDAENKKNYTYDYKVLPPKVQDNDAIEAVLFAQET